MGPRARTGCARARAQSTKLFQGGLLSCSKVDSPLPPGTRLCGLGERLHVVLGYSEATCSRRQPWRTGSFRQEALPASQPVGIACTLAHASTIIQRV